MDHCRSSPLAKTYHSKKEFIDNVIDPFNARMSKPLVPTLGGIFAGWRYGHFPVRCRRPTVTASPIQHLYLVFSDEGRKSRQSDCILRQQGFRRILESRVSEALKDGRRNGPSIRHDVGRVEARI
jgi:hypothetical protein